MSKVGQALLNELAAILRVRRPHLPGASLGVRRRDVVELIKLVSQIVAPRREADVSNVTVLTEADNRDLAPRLRQTLDYLLTGDSEKQIARKLAISPHTVHVYVKSLYKKFDVSSRGELLARWVKR